jgi:tetratricopeptide (TPR) repeat protein
VASLSRTPHGLWRDDPRLIAAALALLTLLAFAPATDGWFLWDDDAHVTRPELRSLSGLGRIWFDLGATQQYYPVLHSAFWLEHAIWGNQAAAYHVVNIALHATAAFLFFLILRRLEVPGAALAAGLFALHPVHVESVAWISEQKNTLSLAFALAALRVYLAFDVSRKASVYAIATVLFALGLLSKTVVAVLPAALLVLFWWRDGTISVRRQVIPLLPWFAASLAAGLLTAWFERTFLGADSRVGLSVIERCLLAGRVPWFYLGKLLWPDDLLFIYPRWTLHPSSWAQWLFVAATLAMIGAGWALRRRTRAPLAVALLFVGCLLPALGFFDVYPFVFSYVADHFQYVASLAILAAAGAALATVVARLPVQRRGIGYAACLALLAALGTLTWRQCRQYRDSQTLFEATLAGNPACWMCLVNLGNGALNAGDVQGAIRLLRQALALNPNVSETHNDLGSALIRTGATVEAAEHFREAVRLSPNSVMAHTNLGGALALLGRVAEARAEFQTALRIMPEHEPARQNLRLLDAAAAPAPPR